VAVLQQLGVQATSIIAVLGAASLAIGLALQGALSNVAAGVMILLFRPYKVGDVIETSTRNGTVKSLDLLFTEIATPDNVKVMIPNSKVFGDVILNYSTHRTRRADVVFKVPLKTDLVRCCRRCASGPRAIARVRKEPAPMIEVVDLSEAFAQAAIRVWTAKEDYGPVKTDLMLAAHLWAEDPTRELPPPRPSKAPDPSPAMPGEGGPSPVQAAKRLGKVGDQVLAVLDPHRKPDQGVGDAQRRALIGRDRGVGHDGRMLDQALDPAQALGQREQRVRSSIRLAVLTSPFSSTEMMPPKPPSIWRLARSCCGWLGRPG
jgi:hypothetical protein